MNGRLARTVLLVSVALACGFSGCLGEAGPPGAARAWLRALARGDGLKLGELTCDASQPALQNAALLYSILGILSERVAGERPKADISDLSFRTLRRDKTTAEVQITGRIRLALLLVSQASQVDFVMPMRYERGGWRYCEGPPGPRSAPGLRRGPGAARVDGRELVQAFGYVVAIEPPRLRLTAPAIDLEPRRARLVADAVGMLEWRQNG